MLLRGTSVVRVFKSVAAKILVLTVAMYMSPLLRDSVSCPS